MNGGEWGNCRVCVGLVLLADCTPFNVFADVRGQTRPPEFSHDELASFQVPGVASSFMVMAMLEDRVAEGFVVGNIYSDSKNHYNN